MTSTREKIEESFALLNSLWVATQDASSANHAPCLANGQAPTGTMATHHPGRGNISINPTTSETLSANKRIFPPVQRAPVLDKLAKLTAKRSSLQDSIAASITASTSISKRAFSQSEPTRSRLPSTSPSSSTSTERAKQIRFRPWSREQFHERLSTFKPSTWFDKPQLVNPVECAKYGWINKGDDRLECSGGCGGVAIMRGGVERLPKTTSAPIAKDTESSSPTQEEPHDESLMATEEEDMDDFDFDTEALGPKFHDLLTSCHAKSCPWKNHPCDDNIYKFPVLSRTQAKDEYLDRLTGLELMKDDPLIAKVHHPLTDEELRALRTLFVDKQDNIIVLALFGWRQLQSDVQGGIVRRVIGCTACHTQCIFLPSMLGSTNSSLAPDDADLEQDEESEDGFHVVGSHKWYCYWIDPSKSQEPGKEGWRVLLSTLTAPTRSSVGSNTPDQPELPTKKARLEPREALAQVRRIIRSGRVQQ